MSRFAGIQAALQPTAGKMKPADKALPDDQDDIDETDTDTKSKKKDKEMTEEKINALKAEAKAEGVKETNARMNAVFANTEYAGREKLAHSLLATSLSADEIVTQLAAAPKIEPSALATTVDTEAADNAARAEMTAAIEKNKNSPIETGSAGGASGELDAKAIASVWDSAIDAVSPSLPTQ